jgi:hypothetical protein
MSHGPLAGIVWWGEPVKGTVPIGVKVEWLAVSR